MRTEAPSSPAWSESDLTCPPRAPPEFVAIAAEKTAAINAAFARIRHELERLQPAS